MTKKNKPLSGASLVIPFPGAMKGPALVAPQVVSDPLQLSETPASIQDCAHKRIEVSELQATVTCQDCGEKLNPVGLLLRYAREENRLVMRIQENQKILEKLQSKVRTKCEHCGQMTRVRT